MSIYNICIHGIYVVHCEQSNTKAQIKTVPCGLLVFFGSSFPNLQLFLVYKILNLHPQLTLDLLIKVSSFPIKSPPLFL